MPQIATENDKISVFSRFYATFFKFSKDFVGQNVENVSQRMIQLFNTVVREDKKEEEKIPTK